MDINSKDESFLNFTSLNQLQSLVDPNIFQQVCKNVEEKGALPPRLDWQGNFHKQTFEELKLKHPLKKYNDSETKYVDDGLDPDGAKTSRQIEDQENVVSTILKVDDELQAFKRQKTVFGHQIHNEGIGAPVFNVQFDNTGEYVISGSDDGGNRFVKIWSRRNMILQKTLFGHTNAITDIIISPCNKFIVTSGVDGLIIIWNLKNGVEVARMTEHATSQINNMKFVETFLEQIDDKQSEDPKERQVEGKKKKFMNKTWIITGSDEGKIVLYDFSSYIQSENDYEDLLNERKTRKKLKKVPKGPYCIQMWHQESYKPGSRRNKKIDSIAMSKDGYIMGGCNTGELLVFHCKLNELYDRTCQPAFKGLFKIHKRSIHCCVFNHIKNAAGMMMTGSNDGQAVIWDLTGDNRTITKNLDQAFNKSNAKVVIEKPLNKIAQNALNQNQKDIFQQASRGQKQLCQIDTCCWSIKGRYAFAVVSGKVDRDVRIVSTKIKIWDRIMEGKAFDLTKICKIKLDTFCLVVAPHPIHERILMTASSGGRIILWDIQAKTVLKEFIEYSVYTIETYTFNDSYDGKFSPDGKCFITGSKWGSISLWSPEISEEVFSATPVQQFCQFENQMRAVMPQGEQQLCNLNLIPHEHQPIRTQYVQEQPQLTIQEIEHNQLMRQETCRQEEYYFNNLLQDGLERNIFNQPEDSRIADPFEENKFSQPIDGLSNIERRENSEEYKSNEEARVIRQIPRGNRASPGRRRLERHEDIIQEDLNDGDFEINDSPSNSEEEDENMDDEGEEQSKPQPRRFDTNNRFGFADGQLSRQTQQRYQRAQTRSRNRGDSHEQIPTRSRRKGNMLDMMSDDEHMIESSDEEYGAEKSRQTRNQNRRLTRMREEEKEVTQVITTNRGRQVQRRKGQYREDSDDSQRQRQQANRQRQRVRIVAEDEDGTNEELKGDGEYKIVERKVQKNELCQFCKRADLPLIKMQNKVDPRKEYTVHLDCVERNYNKCFSVKDKTFKNIQRGIEANTKESKPCSRCKFNYATVKCVSCPRYYHGHLCSRLWMIPDGAAHKFICLFCLNANNMANYESLNETERTLKEEIFLDQRLECIELPFNLTKPEKGGLYVPQVGDKVYYFFQGHERLICEYSCFFFEGIYNLTDQDLPWKKHPTLTKTTLCTIKSINFKYPTDQTMYLLDLYRVSINQQPRVMMEMILEAENEKFSFSATYMAVDELEPFIVPAYAYEDVVGPYHDLNSRGQLVGKMIKTITNLLVEIKNVCALEPTTYPDSNWNTITYEVQEDRVLRRSKQQNKGSEQLNQMNYWYLQFNNVEIDWWGTNPQFDLPVQLHAANEISRFIQENKKIVTDFENVVKENIAPKYDNIVPIQMNLTFIMQRLKKGYYRHIDGLIGDVGLIFVNSETYNGDNIITENASKVVQKLCKELRGIFAGLDSVSDMRPSEETTRSQRRNQQQQEEVKRKPHPIDFKSNDSGKLTAVLPKSSSFLGFSDDILKPVDKKSDTFISIPNIVRPNGNNVLKQISQRMSSESGEIMEPRRATRNKGQEMAMQSEELTPPTNLPEKVQKADTQRPATVDADSGEKQLGVKRTTRQREPVNYLEDVDTDRGRKSTKRIKYD